MKIQREHVGPSQPVYNYETIYHKHKKTFVKSGLWSIAFIFVLFFMLDYAITRWLTVGTFLDLQVFITLSFVIVTLLGLIDRFPNMMKAYMASREDNIRRVLSCKKILASYKEELLGVDCDILSLDNLSDEGMAPQEFEQIIRNILSARIAAQPKKQAVSRNHAPSKSQNVDSPDKKSKQDEKESILLSFREKEHEIKTRVRKGTLSQQQATVLIESARREAKKKLHQLDDFDV